MKKSLTFFALLFLTATAVNKVQAQTVASCIHDAFGYTWTTTMTVTGTKYSGTGKMDLNDGSPTWKAKISGTCGGSTKLKGTNRYADGCVSGYTDYFIYEGTAQAGTFYGEFRYEGSGSWTSYCSGGVYNSGTWSARDCYDLGAGRSKFDPKGPAGHAVASLIKVSPNPVNGQANISYSVAKSGTVNITIYNTTQQVVKVLVNDFKNAGNYSAVWDTKTASVNSGVYRVVAVIDGKTTSTTVQVVK